MLLAGRHGERRRSSSFPDGGDPRRLRQESSAATRCTAPFTTTPRISCSSRPSSIACRRGGHGPHEARRDDSVRRGRPLRHSQTPSSARCTCSRPRRNSTWTRACLARRSLKKFTSNLKRRLKIMHEVADQIEPPLPDITPPHLGNEIQGEAERVVIENNLIRALLEYAVTWSSSN